MSIFRRFFAHKPQPPSPFINAETRRSILVDTGIDKRTAADINVKHNYAVQRFSRAPYDLKTRVVVVTHAEGFLATLEWRWKDPNRDGRTIVAVTSGVNGSKKLAISEACRAMLTKQKLLEDSDTAQKEALSEIEELMNSGKHGPAAKVLLQWCTHSDMTLKSVSHLFPSLWRGVIGAHDRRSAECLLAALEQCPIPVGLYETIIQELVYLSNFTLAESLLERLASFRVEVPERGLLASSEKTTDAEVERWKFWRSMLAIEELSNINSALSNRDQLLSFELSVDPGTTLPLFKLRGDVGDNTVPNDSVVLLSSGDLYLTGKITESSMRPDGDTVLTVNLLTEESPNQLVLSPRLTLTVLSESRITFERIRNCLREFFKVSSVPDLSYRFDPLIRGLLLRQASITPKPLLADLTRERRYLNLSEAQLLAVLHAMSHPLTLIHGPAGTGKTHTLCGIVSGWQSLDSGKILCCADSNTASDNIYEALRRKNVQAFRLTTWKTDIAEEVLHALPNKGLVDKYRSARAGGNTVKTNKGYLMGLRKQIEEEAVRHFKVIVTTLSSARNSVLDKVIFPNVIIDESAQTIEPSALLAVSHGCERLVLIGDHKQLPAVVLSKSATEKGFNKSLFERLIEEGWNSILLNVQRRMHPAISVWPNNAFYDGKLEDHESTANDDMEQIKRFPWLTKKNRVVVVDTEGTGNEELVGTSTRNVGESAILAEVIDRIVRSDTVQSHNVGVVVPYLAQRQSLIAELRKRGLQHAGIQINTVEGFQGHERDIMIISTTRSNAIGALGFLDDDQRMNVMLTRAKKGIVIVGDRETLKKRKQTRWASYMDWCDKNATVITGKQLSSHFNS